MLKHVGIKVKTQHLLLHPNFEDRRWSIPEGKTYVCMRIPSVLSSMECSEISEELDRSDNRGIRVNHQSAQTPHPSRIHRRIFIFGSRLKFPFSHADFSIISRIWWQLIGCWNERQSSLCRYRIMEIIANHSLHRPQFIVWPQTTGSTLPVNEDKQVSEWSRVSQAWGLIIYIIVASRGHPTESDP